MELGTFRRGCEAVEDRAGRSLKSPRMLLTLMTHVLATLLTQGLLSLSLVAQDGTQTRAAATVPSFRTYGSLLECREQAKLHIKAVLATAEE